MTTDTIPDQLSDYDFMELLVFDRKVESEGSWSYAYENYGPRFEFNDYADVDRAEVRALQRRRQAAIDAWWDDHREDGCDLHNAHVDESRRRQDDRYVWAFRHENGNVSGVDSEEQARWYVNNDGWRATAVLRRDVPGGEWTVVEDATGMEADSAVRWLRVGDSVLVDGGWLTVVSTDIEVADMRPRGGSAQHHCRFFVLSDGRRLDAALDWEDQPAVRIRRRISVPEGATR